VLRRWLAWNHFTPAARHRFQILHAGDDKQGSVNRIVNAFVAFARKQQVLLARTFNLQTGRERLRTAVWRSRNAALSAWDCERLSVGKPNWSDTLSSPQSAESFSTLRYVSTRLYEVKHGEPKKVIHVSMQLILQ